MLSAETGSEVTFGVGEGEDAFTAQVDGDLKGHFFGTTLEGPWAQD